MKKLRSREAITYPAESLGKNLGTKFSSLDQLVQPLVPMLSYIYVYLFIPYVYLFIPKMNKINSGI